MRCEITGCLGGGCAPPKALHPQRQGLVQLLRLLARVPQHVAPDRQVGRVHVDPVHPCLSDSRLGRLGDSATLARPGSTLTQSTPARPWFGGGGTATSEASVAGGTASNRSAGTATSEARGGADTIAAGPGGAPPGGIMAGGAPAAEIMHGYGLGLLREVAAEGLAKAGKQREA